MMNFKTLFTASILLVMLMVTGCAKNTTGMVYTNSGDEIAVGYRSTASSADLTFYAIDGNNDWQEFDAESTVTTGSTACLSYSILEPILGADLANAIGTWFCATGGIIISDEYVFYQPTLQVYAAKYKVEHSDSTPMNFFPYSAGQYGADCFEDEWDADNTLTFLDFYDIVDSCNGEDFRVIYFINRT